MSNDSESDDGNSTSDSDSGTDGDEGGSKEGSSEDTDGYESAFDNEDSDAESDDSDFEPAGERGGGGGGAKRGGSTGAGQEKKKAADKPDETGGRSGGNDYEELDMVFVSDSEDNGHGTESVDARKKKTGGRVSAFQWLVRPRKGREETDKRQTASNLEISGAKDAVVKERKTDRRGLTLVE